MNLKVFEKGTFYPIFVSWLEYQTFHNQTHFYHSNTRLVQFSNSHFISAFSVNFACKEEKRGDKIPQDRGTGANTPFTKQSRKNERDNGHDNIHLLESYSNT